MGKATLKKPANASSGDFYIRTKKSKKGRVLWYLWHEFYVSGKKKQAAVPKKIYAEFGLNPEASVMEAKDRVTRLNKERRLEAGSHARAVRNAEDKITLDDTYFPEEYVEDFLGF